MAEEKLGFFARLKAGLAKTRQHLSSDFDRTFLGHDRVDDDFYDELEEVLIMDDIGIHATDEIMENLRRKVKEKHIRIPSEVRELLVENIREQMHVDEHAYDFEKGPSVVLVVGVNGVGKTTSIGKLASVYRSEGKKVLIAAADTFRLRRSSSKSGQSAPAST